MQTEIILILKQLNKMTFGLNEILKKLDKLLELQETKSNDDCYDPDPVIYIKPPTL